MRPLRLLLVLVTLALAALPAFAVNPDEIMDDPALEARARAISANLRCLVCQNQSIDDSDAELAGDLRVLVRERLAMGDTDAEVLDYVVDRYGEFVLLNPVMAPHTLVLWIAAPVLLIVGIVAIALAARRRWSDQQADIIELTADERQALRTLESGGHDR